MEQFKIINASEAHELTDKIIHEDNECLKPIMNKIYECIKNKLYNCYISGTTPDYVVQKLKDLGYKVKLERGDSYDPISQDLYYISW